MFLTTALAAVPAVSLAHGFANASNGTANLSTALKSATVWQFVNGNETTYGVDIVGAAADNDSVTIGGLEFVEGADESQTLTIVGGVADSENSALDTVVITGEAAVTEAVEGIIGEEIDESPEVVKRQNATVTAETNVTVKESSSKHGPASFKWPHARPWSSIYDNDEPCGSSPNTTIGVRTKFPINDGLIAIWLDDPLVDVTINWAPGNSDPADNSEFVGLRVTQTTESDEDGYRCYDVPNLRVVAGVNATIQLKSLSPGPSGDWTDSNSDSEEGETYYSCADVTFVEAADMHERPTCFKEPEAPPHPDDCETSGSEGDSDVEDGFEGAASSLQISKAGVKVTLAFVTLLTGSFLLF